MGLKGDQLQDVYVVWGLLSLDLETSYLKLIRALREYKVNKMPRYRRENRVIILQR